MFGFLAPLLSSLGGAGAVMSAAAPIVGGLIDNAQRNKELRMQDPAFIRERFEAAGFNPLLGIDKALGGLGYGPVMGSALSDAAVIYNNVTSSNRDFQLRQTALEQENQRLQEAMQQSILRPRDRGIYSNGSNQGGAAGAGGDLAGGPAGGPAPLGSTSHVAPDRDVVIMPYASGAGLTEISNDFTNRWLGGPIVVPGADGEPWGIDEVATAVVAAPFSAASNYDRAFVDRTGLPPTAYNVMAERYGYGPFLKTPWAEFARHNNPYPTYDPAKNPPLRGYYGPPGSRTGF